MHRRVLASSLLFTPAWRAAGEKEYISRNITSLPHVKKKSPYPLSRSGYFDQARRKIGGKWKCEVDKDGGDGVV